MASETATSLKDSPLSGVAPFSFPSIIPAASYNNTSLTFALDSHMPSSSPNIYSSARVPSSKVNQTSREAISDTQLNFPWFPPFAPVAMTPRNSFDTPTQYQQPVSVGPRFLSNQQNVLIHETGQDVRMQHPLRPVTQSSLGPHSQQQQKRPLTRLPAPVGSPPFLVKQEPLSFKQEPWMRRQDPMKLEPSLIKCEPMFDKQDLRDVAQLEKDVMVIKQEEPWHHQLLRQQHQQLVSPLLERQRGERRALVDKLLREMAVKMDKEPNQDQQGVKEPQEMPLLELDRASGTSFQAQVMTFEMVYSYESNLVFSFRWSYQQVREALPNSGQSLDMQDLHSPSTLQPPSILRQLLHLHRHPPPPTPFLAPPSLLPPQTFTCPQW